MRRINLANEKKRDATLGFEAKPTRKRVTQRLSGGSEKRNISFIKSTVETSLATLTESTASSDALGEAIIKHDIDIDFEQVGRIIGSTKKLHVDQNGEALFRVNLLDITYDVAGQETSSKPAEARESNICIDTLPIRWSGKFIPKADAVRRFVFSRHYQLKHTNGLTFDFLYDMAKQLDDKQALMFVGAGPKGNEPLVLASGGTPYRAFLEGRTSADQYCLLLHLTNLELKEFTQ